MLFYFRIILLKSGNWVDKSKVKNKKEERVEEDTLSFFGEKD